MVHKEEEKADNSVGHNSDVISKKNKNVISFFLRIMESSEKLMNSPLWEKVNKKMCTSCLLADGGNRAHLHEI